MQAGLVLSQETCERRRMPGLQTGKAGGHISTCAEWQKMNNFDTAATPKHYH